MIGHDEFNSLLQAVGKEMSASEFRVHVLNKFASKGSGLDFRGFTDFLKYTS